MSFSLMIRDTEHKDHRFSSIAKTDVKAGDIDITLDIYDYFQEDIVKSHHQQRPTLFYGNTATRFPSLMRLFILSFKKIWLAKHLE